MSAPHLQPPLGPNGPHETTMPVLLARVAELRKARDYHRAEAARQRQSALAAAKKAGSSARSAEQHEGRANSLAAEVVRLEKLVGLTPAPAAATPAPEPALVSRAPAAQDTARRIVSRAEAEQGVALRLVPVSPACVDLSIDGRDGIRLKLKPAALLALLATPGPNGLPVWQKVEVVRRRLAAWLSEPVESEAFRKMVQRLRKALWDAHLNGDILRHENGQIRLFLSCPAEIVDVPGCPRLSRVAAAACPKPGRARRSAARKVSRAGASGRRRQKRRKMRA